MLDKDNPDCLCNEPNAHQGNDGVWRINRNPWISICHCGHCREIERRKYLESLRGLSENAKNFLMAI